MILPPYRRWYRFGLRSPEVLYGRLRNKYRPTIWLRDFYQRGRHGISDSDSCSLSHYLAKTTVIGVRQIRKWAHGYPDGLSADEWDGILAKIEDGFQAWLSEDGWIEGTESRAKFDEAMSLYAKWFGELWD